MKNITSNLVKISELLNDNQYHDGTSIGKQLNITRAAVWKVMKKLEQYGVELKSVKGKGYLLEEPLLLLEEKKLKSYLRNPAIKVDILEKTASTNDYLRNVIAQNKDPRVCLAELQTHGKGRLNRQWHSPFGQNIYFSLLYPFQKDISELSGLSLVVGLATCRALETLLRLKDTFFVKWPNDIVVKQQKIAGTLIEIQAESHGFCQAIIGIGINVNMQQASKKQINQPWSSLLNLTGQHHDRNHLCAELINVLLEYIERFCRSGLKDFIQEWKSKDSLLNQPLEIISAGKQVSGLGAGINDQGHLLLTTKNKTLQAFASGDTSLLK